MELREIIELAEEKSGGRPQLAKALGIASNNITDAKGNRRGLPVGVCVMLADITGIEPMQVIAASELVTEKNEQRRASLLPYIRHAAAITGAVVSAFVINVMTPTPAEAAPAMKEGSETFYIMLSYLHSQHGRQPRTGRTN